MTVTEINTSTFLSDTVIFIRDELRDNITDPIVASRVGNEQFVMTSYPQRDVKYPIITVQNTDISTPVRMGMQSELHFTSLPLEIRVWARNTKEKDLLTQDVINQLRGIELDNDGTVNASLFGFEVLSAVNVDEPGEGGVRSKVIAVQYKIILGA